jgi:subtilisin family serine protease
MVVLITVTVLITAVSTTVAWAQTPEQNNALMEDLSDASDNPVATREAVIGIFGEDMQGKDGQLARLGLRLAEMAREAEAGPRSTNMVQENFINEYVLIDAVATDDPQGLLDNLQGIGLLDGIVYGRVVSGRLPKAAIIRLVDLPNLLSVSPTVVEAQRGIVRSQGDRALAADRARSLFGVTGAGVSVVTFSDSFDRTLVRYTTNAATDIARGDLPADVSVSLESLLAPSATIDEGRAMMQIIADIAPNAQQIFHSAFMGQARFAASIEALAGQGVDIMVDDVVYPLQPMFQDGIISQAIDKAAASGVTYFSAAGNQGRKSYEAPFVPSGFAGLRSGEFHAFADGVVFQEIEIPVGKQGRFILQWDEPFASTQIGSAGAQNDVDFYLLDSNANILRAGIEDNILRGDPIEWFDYRNRGDIDTNSDSQPDTRFYLAIEHVAGNPPNLVKHVITGDDVRIISFVTNSPTVYGHAAAAGAIAVGSVAYFNTPAFDRLPVRSIFSSTGGVPILFDVNGTRFTEPVIRLKPDILAPTGVNTTFFGSDSDGDGFPNFSGTSAAAPHAAAVAALMLEQRPTLTPAAIRAIMQQTALDMDDDDTPGFDTGFDSATGYGLLQAERVLGNVLSVVDKAAGSSTPLVINPTVSAANIPAAMQLVMQVPPMLPDAFVSALQIRVTGTAGTRIDFMQPLLSEGVISVVFDANQNGQVDAGENAVAFAPLAPTMMLRFVPLRVPSGSSLSLLVVYQRNRQSRWLNWLPWALAALLPWRYGRLGKPVRVVSIACLTLLSGCLVEPELPTSSQARFILTNVNANTEQGSALNISGLPVRGRPLLIADVVAEN